MRWDQGNHEKYVIAVAKFVYKNVYPSQKEESNGPQIFFKHNRFYLTYIWQKKKECQMEFQKKKTKLRYIPNKERTKEARKTTQ